MGMAQKPRPKLKPDELGGWRFVRRLEPQLAQLATASRRHGNQVVLLSHVLVAHLLAFFNPVVASLRRLDDFFDLPGVRKRLQTPRLPKSTLSDAQRLFDPALLLPIVETLKSKLHLTPHRPRLDQLTQQLLAVDGSFFAVAARIVWAVYNKPKAQDLAGPGHVRIDVHFDVLRGVPVFAGPVTNGQAQEAAQLQHALQPHTLYLLDAGFHVYDLLAAIHAQGSDFLVRIRRAVPFEIVTELPLSLADRAAGVVRQASVRIPGHRARVLAQVPLRWVEIQTAEGEIIQLLTSRGDLPAEVIGTAYHYRWQIELFFRWLKYAANFQHFLSESAEGMTLQLYAALIGVLLLALEAQRAPTVYDFALLQHYFNGWASWEQMRAQMDKRAREREQARRRRAAKKTAR
jgi:hypothetical protein